jgi:hypothetical protein
MGPPSTWVAALVDWWPSSFVAAFRHSELTSRPPRSDWLGAAEPRHSVATYSGRCLRLGGDPLRVLRRATDLLGRGGNCIVEFDAMARGVRHDWVRLESSRAIGPWFRWASVGIDCAAEMAEKASLTLTKIHPIGNRVVASLTAA